MATHNLIRRNIWRCVGWLAGFAALARPTLAALDDTSAPLPEARYQGYGVNVALTDTSSNALYWLLIVVLGMMVVAAIFKSPRRTHLD